MTALSDEYDLWKCDECRLAWPSSAPQTKVRIQQVTERIYGTDETYRPIETLVICPRCVQDKYKKVKP